MLVLVPVFVSVLVPVLTVALVSVQVFALVFVLRLVSRWMSSLAVGQLVLVSVSVPMSK